MYDPEPVSPHWRHQADILPPSKYLRNALINTENVEIVSSYFIPVYYNFDKLPLKNRYQLFKLLFYLE